MPTKTARKKKRAIFKKAPAKRKLTKFRPQIKTRHPSHTPLRAEMSLLPFRTVVRLGSTTIMKDEISKGGSRIDCNPVQGVRNSADKRETKRIFTKENIPTPNWYTIINKTTFSEKESSSSRINIADMPYPVVVKARFGSRGRGNYLINSREEMANLLSSNKELSRYIVEEYCKYSREYRIHSTKNNTFYVLRKMLREDVPKADRWIRNDSTCVWILDTNSSFDTPVNWKEITDMCTKAINTVGLDLGAVDVKVQSASTKKGRRKRCEFSILETNSAPSFGDLTLNHYKREIKNILINKYK